MNGIIGAIIVAACLSGCASKKGPVACPSPFRMAECLETVIVEIPPFELRIQGRLQVAPPGWTIVRYEQNDTITIVSPDKIDVVVPEQP